MTTDTYNPHILSGAFHILSHSVKRNYCKSWLTAQLCLDHYEPESSSFQTCQKQIWISCYYCAWGKHWNNEDVGQQHLCKWKNTPLCFQYKHADHSLFLFKVIFLIINIVKKMTRTISDPNLQPNRGVCGRYRSSSLQADLGIVFCTLMVQIVLMSFLKCVSIDCYNSGCSSRYYWQTCIVVVLHHILVLYEI